MNICSAGCDRHTYLLILYHGTAAGIFVCAVGDLVGFLALLRFCGGEEEEEDDLLGFVPLHRGPED